MSASAPRLPEVTVILPVFNGDRTISEQLSAVLGQETNFTFELLVVDNGSTDRTAPIVDALANADPRVRRVLAPDQHNLS